LNYPNGPKYFSPDLVVRLPGLTLRITKIRR
jgi:hypothetical protein